jgi:hypothetical protein
MSHRITVPVGPHPVLYYCDVRTKQYWLCQDTYLQCTRMGEVFFEIPDITFMNGVKS